VGEKKYIAKSKERKGGGSVGKFPGAFYTRVAMTSFLYVKETSCTFLRNNMRIQVLFIYHIHKVSIYCNSPIANDFVFLLRASFFYFPPSSFPPNVFFLYPAPDISHSFLFFYSIYFPLS